MSRCSPSSQQKADITFPFRVKVVVPSTGLGALSAELDRWADSHLGPGNWGRGAVVAIGADATGFHFRTLANLTAFLDALPQLEIAG